MVNHGGITPGNPYGSLENQDVIAVTLGEPETYDPNLKPPWFGRTRVRMNLIAIFICMFFPWALFNLTFADLSFRIHYKHPQLCWAFVGLCIFLVLGIAGLAASNFSLMLKKSIRYEPSWFIFLFLSSSAAIVLGTFFGHQNFWNNMQPYYVLQGLNDYSGVDPSRMKGQQMMDAGRVMFIYNATLDLRRAYAFQNLDTYCVAPISIYSTYMGSPLPLNSYDFWAVGINCCDGNETNAVNFKCGTFSDLSGYQKQYEGLRIVDDEKRPFYRLAVQQAEASFALKANHPLFFHWTDDAVEGINKYEKTAYRNFATAMCLTFIFQGILVLMVTLGVAKTGHHNL